MGPIPSITIAFEGSSDNCAGKHIRFRKGHITENQVW